MAAYRRVYDSHHLQADCQEPGSAREPYARQSSMGYLYLFYSVQCASVTNYFVSRTRSPSSEHVYLVGLFALEFAYCS